MVAAHPALVSVVIPAYNAESTIAAQLDALAAQQTDVPFEVLVCDNGSTDATRSVALSYAASIPRLRVVDASARRGPAAARNIGVSQAAAERVLFCDADDIVEAGWVKAMSDALGVADLVAGALDGRSLNTGNRASVSWEVSADIRMPFWTRFGAGASSNLAVRRSVFLEVDGFDERLQTGEDVDFCWRVQLAGHSFARCPSAVVRSRQRDGRRAVFRQAYSYGAGTRALRLKYARYVDADDGPAPAPDRIVGPASPIPAAPAEERRSALRRIARLFTATGQANAAWRLGEWLGSRWGRVDAAITPLHP